MAGFFRGNWRSLAGLILSLLVLAGLTVLLWRDLGWASLLPLLGGLWLGHWLRKLRATRALARAEELWAREASASEVAAELSAVAPPGGELGCRIRQLRGRAHLALAWRDSAWDGFLEAELARLAAWKRPLLRRLFVQGAEAPSPARLAWTRRALRLAPRMGRLEHLLGLLLLRTDRPEEAWERFARALPLSAEDPMVLEDLMRAGFSLGRTGLAEGALRLLQARHGDPRVPWDRAAAAYHLLRSGRPLDALALARQLPDAQRSLPMHWLAEAVPLRILGNFPAAAEVLDRGLAALPAAFGLWFERHRVALAQGDDEAALDALDKAEACLPVGEPGREPRQDWALLRAEAAFWIEDDPERAWDLLSTLPREAQGDHRPPLRLQLLSALGRFEEAYAEVTELLKAAPQDPELLLLQADAMAGLEAWKALPDFLDGLPEACREQAGFWHLRGLAEAHVGDPIRARQELERAAQMDPRRLRHPLDAGHACAELGEWERAEMHWRQALRLDPRCEEALIQLSDARREQHDPEGSRRYLRECLLYYPDSADAQDRLAELEAH